MGAAVAYIRSAGVVRNSGAYRISGQNCVAVSLRHRHPSSEKRFLWTLLRVRIILANVD